MSDFSRSDCISTLIASASSFELVAKVPISLATTAKPFPASPARAASIEAFKERRLVCVAIAVIPSTFSLITSTASFVASIALLISSILLDVSSLDFWRLSIEVDVVFEAFSISSAASEITTDVSLIDVTETFTVSVAFTAVCISSACCVAPDAISCTAFETSSVVCEIWFVISDRSVEETATALECFLMLLTISVSLSISEFVLLIITPNSSFLSFLLSIFSNSPFDNLLSVFVISWTGLLILFAVKIAISDAIITIIIEIIININALCFAAAKTLSLLATTATE